MLIEACAGIKDDENEHDAMLREIEDETGFRLTGAKRIFDLYSTPGAVTEMLHYFIAEYKDENKISVGGGLQQEQEEIEVIEMPFTEAYNKVTTGEIKDAKTVTLLLLQKQNNATGTGILSLQAGR